MRVHGNIILIILLCSSLFLVSFVNTTPNLNSDVQESPPVKFRVSYTSYPEPIIVIGDDMFQSLAENESWAGDGSELTPYIIEGYSFEFYETCISVTDVSLYFEIRNCYMTHNGTLGPNSFGIDLFNVSHFSIYGSGIFQKSAGIYMSNCPGAAISNTTIFEIERQGIYAFISPRVVIDSCYIYDIGWYGMEIGECNNTIIMNNHIHNCEQQGVYLINSYFGVIEDNTIYSNIGSGIYLELANNCTIENNIIYDNLFFDMPTCGIHLWSSESSVIVGNQIYDNAQNGIYGVYSPYAYIFDNEIYGNSDHGIDFLFSAYGYVGQNIIHSNGWWPVILNALCGIYLDPTANGWTIEGNEIYNNTPTGISAFADHTNITNNDIYENTDQGISSHSTDYCWVIENRIWGNGWDLKGPIPAGIFMDGCDYWTIDGNTIYENNLDGVYGWGDSNILNDNEVFNNTRYGLFLEECYSNIYSDNIVYNNEYGLYIVNQYSNVTNNIVFDNDYGIYLYNSADMHVYGNDVGWNGLNAWEGLSFGGPIMWYDGVNQVGNHWSDWTGTGNYNIYNDTAITNSDIYPSYSLHIEAASPLSYEVSEPWTEKVMLWNAYSPHPTHFIAYIDGAIYQDEEWDGEMISLVVDGIPAGLHTILVEVYHISGHSSSASSTVNVFDTTAPEWIIPPSDQQINEGESLSVQFSAEDFSGVDMYWVNDTSNFHISESGVLTNNTVLSFGDYGLRVYVNDTFGNINDYEIRIRVLFVPETTSTIGSTTSIETSTTSIETSTTTSSTTPVIFDPTAMLLLVGIGGVVVVILVVVLISKKR